MDDLFERLLKVTYENEEINECPLILCGIWFNTNNDGKYLDAEGQNAGEIITDGDDLLEFLTLCDVSPEDIEKALLM